MSSGSIIIVGVSTRSAAASCARAGLRPVCLDLFGDRDLCELAEVHVLSDLDEARQRLDQLSSRFDRSTPVIYTGGVENRPELILQIESLWTLWGCGSNSVRAIRDPLQLAAALRNSKCPALDATLHPPPDGRKWLRKPLRSGGGLGISLFRKGAADAPHDSYLQQFREGQPMSALFAASQSESRCELLGVCRQLVGEARLHATPFAWCGAIGPIDLDATTLSLLTKIGQTLSDSFALAGLFGVDFILDDDDIPWVTEVNPRYTGSTEVLEFATGRSLIQRHAGCFGASLRQTAMTTIPAQRQFVGKAILYASADLVAQTEEWPRGEMCESPPTVADVPPQGQQISAGAPVCTVFAVGETESLCETALLATASRIDQQIALWVRNTAISR